jgi:hypothetical protein
MATAIASSLNLEISQTLQLQPYVQLFTNQHLLYHRFITTTPNDKDYLGLPMSNKRPQINGPLIHAPQITV